MKISSESCGCWGMFASLINRLRPEQRINDLPIQRMLCRMNRSEIRACRKHLTVEAAQKSFPARRVRINGSFPGDVRSEHARANRADALQQLLFRQHPLIPIGLDDRLGKNVFIDREVNPISAIREDQL